MWKKCACLIFVSGILEGKFSRLSTCLTDWEPARELASTRKSWTDEPAATPLAPPSIPPVSNAALVSDDQVVAL